jgi:perosamine synthetase
VNRESRILYAKPSVTELEVRYVQDAAAHGWGEGCYEYISRFEKAFARHLGVRHAIATSSGTGALHLGLAGLGISSGDEVILGDINWIASAAPILHLGATPVLVDVLPDSWCLDPSLVEAAITPRTRAILAVHLYGNLCDLDALLDIGARHGIPVIEDAAEAIGSGLRGRPAGGFGKFGAFSFHGTKTLSTGEGGMFVTDDDELLERVRTLSNHGRSRNEARQFWPERVGFKYKMSNLQAAMGCAQVERLPDLVSGKRRVFEYYARALDDLPIDMNPEPPGTTNGYWMPTIVPRRGYAHDREMLLRMFAENNVDGRVFFWPLSTLGMFPAHPEHAESHRLGTTGLNLPSYHDLTPKEMDRVIALVRRWMRR